MTRFDEFLASQAYSLSTNAGYRYYIKRFSGWLDKRGTPIEEASALDFKDFAASTGWKTATIYAAVCAVRGYWRWAFGPDHSLARVKARKAPMSPQRTVTAREILQVLSTIATSTAWRSKHSYRRARDLAMICMLLDTGLRAGEICSLRMSHLDLDTRSLAVSAKGNRWRRCVFSPLTARVIREWLPYREKLCTVEARDFVFVSVGGLKLGTPLTRHGLRANFYKLAKASGVKSFGPHAFRRSFAVTSIKKGVPIRILQLQGGWADIAQVQRYSQMIELDAEDMTRYFAAEGLAETLPVSTRTV